METFNIKCPHCNGELEVNTEWIGMETACPICSKAFVIPDAAEDRTENDLPLPETIPYAPILDLPQNVSRQDAKRLRSTAEKGINNWLKTIPGAESLSIKELVEFKSIAVCNLYTLRSDLTIKSRTFQKFERPYKGETLPEEILVPCDKDFWRFNPDSEDPFTVEIRETLETYTCHTCHGDGHVNCPVCRGHKKVDCKKCKGSGKVMCFHCHGDGQVDVGREIVSRQKTCNWCNGKPGNYNCTTCGGTGRYFENERISEWQTCGYCFGSGRVDCENCNGTGEVRCENCKGSGHVTCSTCTGTGKLKSGYDLMQTVTSQTHYALWSPEKQLPVEKLNNHEALHDSGTKHFNASFNDIQLNIPDGVDESDTLAFSHLLRQLGEAYEPQVFRKFKSHDMSLSKQEIICYSGTNEAMGKTFRFWVNAASGTVIDEQGLLNALVKSIIKASDEESDPVKSIRLAAQAFSINQDQNDAVPEKLLLAKYTNEYNKLFWRNVLLLFPFSFAIIFLLSTRKSFDSEFVFISLFSLGASLFFCKPALKRLCRHCTSVKKVPHVIFLWGILSAFIGVPVLEILITIFSHSTESKKIDYCDASLPFFEDKKETFKAFAASHTLMLFSSLCALLAAAATLGVAELGRSGQWEINNVTNVIVIPIILLAAFILNQIVFSKKIKKIKPVVCNDILQKGLDIGVWADRKDILPFTTSEEKKYALMILSVPGENASAVCKAIDNLFHSFSALPEYKQKKITSDKLKKGKKLTIASAATPELLFEVADHLRTAGAEVQIINEKDDKSADFAKANPAVKADPPNTDYPYALVLFHLGKRPEKCCELIYNTTGKVKTPQEIKDTLHKNKIIPLFSAASGKVLQKIAADFRATGIGVGILSTLTEENFQLILLSAGDNLDAVSELASSYIDDTSPLPASLLAGITLDDAQCCKAQFDALGAETIILPFSNVSCKKTKHSCSIRLSSLGGSPQKVIRLLKCFGTELNPEEKGFPIHVLSANTPQTLLEHLNCLKQAGAVVWIKDKRKNSSTYRVLLLRNGKNREQTRSLLLTCSLNEHIREYDEIIPPLEIMTQITPQDAELCQKCFSEIGAVTVALNSDVVFDIGRDYKFMLYISSPGKNPEAVAVLVNLMRNKKDIVETIFEKNLTPIVSSQNADLLIPYLNALLDYGASAWIMNIDDADEKYNLYITDVAGMTPTLKKKINEIIGYKLEMTEERLKLPIKLLSDAIPQDIERCSALFRDDPGVKLLSLDYVPELKDGDKKECELVVFNKGNDPEFFDTLMKCCASNDYKEKISGSNLPLTICESTSPEKLKSRAECLRIAGGSAWICSYSETVTTYKVVISDFGNAPEKIIDLIRKYAFNYQFWQNRTPVAPVILMTNLLKTESAVLGAICKDCGAVISYIKEETDHEFKDPYRIMITYAGKHRDNVAALLQAWKIADSEIAKLYSETPIYVFQAKEEKELLPRLELFRISGAFAWICKPNDPQRTFKVMLESIGPNREQVMQLLSQFSISSINGISDQQTKAVEIIKNLTKTSAEECNSLFQSIGANTYCSNFLGDKI